MICNAPITTWQKGDEVEGFYLLSDAAVKTSNAGKPFLSATVRDGSGAMALKAWDYAGPIGEQDNGAVVKIRGRVQDYKGALQLVADKLRRAESADEYDLGAIVPTAPIDREAAWQQVCDLMDSMTDPDFQAVARAVLARHEAAFRAIPAAKSVHHGFVGGLLMHTSRMLSIADFLTRLYPDVVNRDLVLTGTLCHDMAKDAEFAFSPAGLVTDYTIPGRLLGHSVMEAREIAELCAELSIPAEKSTLLQHLILSHHGQPEFGAAVIPQCAEAELLHHIDLIDSRMEIYAEELSHLDKGGVSGRIYALDKRIYRPNLD